MQLGVDGGGEGGGEGAVEDALDSWRPSKTTLMMLAASIWRTRSVRSMTFMWFFDVELVGREAAGELVGVVVVGHYEGRVEEVGADVLFQHDLSRIEAEGSLRVGRPK